MSDNYIIEIRHDSRVQAAVCSAHDRTGQVNERCTPPLCAVHPDASSLLVPTGVRQLSDYLPSRASVVLPRR